MSEPVSSGFNGTGWAFPIRLDPAGQVQLTTDGDEAIRDSIWTILGTNPGERVMRPDFGCGIEDYVFDVNDVSTAGAIGRVVTEALSLWEPRIDVLDVTANPDPVDPRRLSVDISYQVRSTNSRTNLVYPFYLE